MSELILCFDYENFHILNWASTFQGDQGAIGETGLNGYDGDKGQKGDVGAPGARGPQGPPVSRFQKNFCNFEESKSSSLLIHLSNYIILRYRQSLI